MITIPNVLSLNISQRLHKWGCYILSYLKQFFSQQGIPQIVRSDNRQSDSTAAMHLYACWYIWLLSHDIITLFPHQGFMESQVRLSRGCLRKSQRVVETIALHSFVWEQNLLTPHCLYLLWCYRGMYFTTICRSCNTVGKLCWRTFTAARNGRRITMIRTQEVYLVCSPGS